MRGGVCVSLFWLNCNVCVEFWVVFFVLCIAVEKKGSTFASAFGNDVMLFWKFLVI